MLQDPSLFLCPLRNHVFQEGCQVLAKSCPLKVRAIEMQSELQMYQKRQVVFCSPSPSKRPQQHVGRRCGPALASRKCQGHSYVLRISPLALLSNTRDRDMQHATQFQYQSWLHSASCGACSLLVCELRVLRLSDEVVWQACESPQTVEQDLTPL